MARQVLEVFLSSTAKDLEPFRQAVHARLIRSGQFHCVWQEDFGPHSATAIEVCRTKVESADVFVGLVGLRRGWEPKGDAAQRSITEMEHDWATAAGKRRYVWVTPDDFPVRGNLRESDTEHERQQAFRERLMGDGALVVSQHEFGSPELLAADVTQHLLMHELVADLQKRGQVAKAERAGLEREIVAKLARRLKPDETLDFEHDALKERTRERVPLNWAMTQNNLGIALQNLGERESGTERLEEAVTAYRGALKELARERVPLQWATTQNNLGIALQALGTRESGTARLEEAVTAYRDALKEHTRERVPLDWAMTQNNLGSVLENLGTRESSIARLEEAVVACQAAIEVFKQPSAGYYLAMAQRNLAQAEAEIASRKPSGSD
jgi:hypothetical protein